MRDKIREILFRACEAEMMCGDAMEKRIEECIDEVIALMKESK